MVALAAPLPGTTYAGTRWSTLAHVEKVRPQFLSLRQSMLFSLPTRREHMSKSEKTNDQRARRKALRAGYRALKSRSRNTFENRGGYMLVDRDTGFPTFGFQFELSPEAVLEYCAT